MSCSDPISDMLVRVRNACAADREVAEIPFSKMKGEVAKILKREGYITDFTVEGGGPKKTMRIYLKYSVGGDAAIRGIVRKSKPGLRVYVTNRDIPLVLGGMGTAVVSTSKGIMTGREARKQNLGGELICTVW